MRKMLLCASILLLLCGCSADSSRQLECPVAQSGSEQGSLRETPQRIAAVGQRLGTGSENEINEAAAEVRARKPNASRAEVVNYLVTAYCPRVRDNPALDRSGKQSALRAFAARVEKIVSKS